VVVCGDFNDAHLHLRYKEMRKCGLSHTNHSLFLSTHIYILATASFINMNKMMVSKQCEIQPNVYR